LEVIRRNEAIEREGERKKEEQREREVKMQESVQSTIER